MMTIKNLKHLLFGAVLSGMVIPSFAGNPDRVGQAGATELLINPWSRSSGWYGVNTAGIRGIEAERFNVAGLAFVKNTEIQLVRTNWLEGSGISLNAAGIAQRIGESSVIGFSLMSMNMGDIEITNMNNPDGGIGFYSPSLVNMGLSYARTFSNRIYGGVTVRLISQSTAEVSSEGVAFDAGIQYVTGKDDRLKFGIAIRNVGTPMRFAGDGLSGRATPENSSLSLTMSQRAERFEIPSLMNIGIQYDIPFTKLQKLVVAGNFTSNSFTNDQFGIGLEYNFGSWFALRGGYNYEKGINDRVTRATAFTGYAAGFSVDIPFNDKGGKFGLDFSWRHTDPFNGTYGIGARITL